MSAGTEVHANLTEAQVREISDDLGEPEWLTETRLDALSALEDLDMPDVIRTPGRDWTNLHDLDFETLGSDAYLALAGWIRKGGQPIEPPALVDQRFTVELVRADGTRSELPLTRPIVGSDAAGTRWEYGSNEARVQISDSCRLTGSFWTWAGARTDEPLELAITDTVSGQTVSHLLWSDRREVSTMADTAALTGCP